MRLCVNAERSQSTQRTTKNTTRCYCELNFFVPFVVLRALCEPVLTKANEHHNPKFDLPKARHSTIFCSSIASLSSALNGETLGKPPLNLRCLPILRVRASSFPGPPPNVAQYSSFKQG